MEKKPQDNVSNVSEFLFNRLFFFFITLNFTDSVNSGNQGYLQFWINNT